MTAASSAPAPRIVIVTNIPAPYRIPIYQRLAKLLGEDKFHVVFCSAKESNRDWSMNVSDFPHTFLRTSYIAWRGRYIHYNPDVFRVLRRLKPDVVITTGFNPTHLLAFVYTRLFNKIHLPKTDGTFESEQVLSPLHRWIRRWVYKRSKAFLGASEGAMRLYRSYGIARELCFQSHLCADNQAFADFPSQPRVYDLMFSGRFAEVKNPLFALDVAAGVAKKLNRKISILLLGSGPLLDQAKQHANDLSAYVDAVFPGFVQQQDLPGYYAQAKIFLFPTAWDPWGVVANEACAAGQAIIVSPHAGVAGELVRNDDNGFVCELELATWIEKAHTLLSNESLLTQFSESSRRLVAPYSYDAAAQGVVDAVANANRSY